MTPESPIDPRQALEASLTALLLGELPPDQAAFLRQVMAGDPELAKMYQRLKRTIDLVRETETTPVDQPAVEPATLKLSDERRQELFQHFKTIAPREFAEPPRRRVPWLLPVAAAVAFLTLISSLLLPSLSRSKSKSMGGTWSMEPLRLPLGDRDASVASAPSAPAVKNPLLFQELPRVQSRNVSTGAQEPPGRVRLASEPRAGSGTAANRGTIVLPEKFQDSMMVSTERQAVQVIGGEALNFEAGKRAVGGFVLAVPKSDSDKPAMLADTFDKVSSGISPGSLAFAPVQSPVPVAMAIAQASGQTFNYFILDDQKPPQAANGQNLIASASGGGGGYGGGIGGGISGGMVPPATPYGGVPASPLPMNAAGRTLSEPARIQLPQAVDPTTGLPIADASTYYRLTKPVEGEALARRYGMKSTENVPPPVVDPTTGLPAGKFPAIDPATGLPIPMTEEAAGNSALGLDGLASTRQKSAVVEAKKRELSQLLASQQALDSRLSKEKLDLSLPKHGSVEIVDRAVPPPQSTGLLSGLGRAFSGESEARARIRIEQDQTDSRSVLGTQTAAAYDPYFIQTEFEIIQSEAVLGKVIKDLNLNKAWARSAGASGELKNAEALRLLKEKLDLRPVPNTGLVEIGVKDPKSEEAANIANAVAEAYQKYRAQQRVQLAAIGEETTRREYAKQQQKIRDTREELARIEAQPSNEQTDAAPPKPPTPLPVPQPEIQTSDNAFSTFSLNVSDVSFKLAAASLEKGVLPDPASIRSEEFINAFDYRDPEAPAGVPIAFAWERARYPFAQNRDLLRFSLKTAAQGRQAGRPLNLVLLLDNSGSMERADRVQIIREALRVLATQLQPQDTFSVVTFARTAHLWVDGVPGNQAGPVADELSKLTPQGGTNLGDAMDLAYQTALRHYLANGINRVVLLTDGAANLGDVEPTSLKAKVETNRKQGIALDCFGIGWEGYNDDLLEVMTRNGDGRYGFINTPEEAATEFAGQLAGALRVAAADVKVQVEFNPNRVTAFRQIGYAKHQLTKEQFRDNTVNAAAIGAAESGNALYVIEASPAGEGPLATVRVRYRVPGTSDYQEREWVVPYTGTAMALEQSSPAMRLAATASAFSEWLATSPYAAEVTPDALLRCLSGVPEVYGADIRPKKLEWMLRQAKSVQGTH